MTIFQKTPKGQAAGPILVVLLLCGALAGVYFTFLKNGEEAVENTELKPAEKKVAEVQAEPVITPEEEPELELEPEPEPEPDLEDVVVNDPDRARKQALVNRYLARKFPFSNITTADEITFGWTEVPKELYPKEVTVNVSRVYKSDLGQKNQYVADGHSSTVIRVIDDKLKVRSVDHPDLTCVVLMDQTDFQDQIRKVHDSKFEEARQAILAQREAFREKAYQVLARNEAKKLQAEKEASLLAEKEGEEENIAKVDFASKKYGRKYGGDYWVEPKNGKNREEGHEIPIGPICGIVDVLYDKREALITSLWEDGPGVEAGLAVGDLIVKINGKQFPTYERSSYQGGVGFPEAIGEAIIDAQDSREPLVLTVKRDMETVDIAVSLPYLPAFAKVYPESCSRTDALVKSSLDYLESVTRDDGTVPANDYTQGWYGLALLSSGDPKNARAAKKLARHLAKKYALGKKPSEKELLNGTERGGSSNWFVGVVGMFLAEYYLATGDKTVLAAARDCSRSLAARIRPKTGRYCHGRAPERLAYDDKGLVIINVHAHILWALEANIVGKEEYDWTTWDISYDCVKSAIGSDEAVGYNFSARGGSQSSCRTGAMLTALALVDKDSSNRRKFAKWLFKNNKTFPDVHAMTFIGPMLGFSGLTNDNPQKFNKVMGEYRWLWSIMQPVNYSHGVYYYGDRGNSGGDNYCNKRVVGNIMTLFTLNSHRKDSLWMFGNRTKYWLK